MSLTNQTVISERPRAPRAKEIAPRRGRPLQFSRPERRQLLLEAAEHVFVELGYSDASMDDIAHRAGMSKKTLYQIFATKESLFAAVVASRCAALPAMTAGDDLTDRRSLDETLRRYLSKFASFVLAPRQQALYWLVMSESRRAPELARALYDEGPSKGCRVLQEWLARQRDLGRLNIADPAGAAEMLFSMVIPAPQSARFARGLGMPTVAEIDERVAQAVSLFLHGVSPQPAQAMRDCPQNNR